MHRWTQQTGAHDQLKGAAYREWCDVATVTLRVSRKRRIIRHIGQSRVHVQFFRARQKIDRLLQFAGSWRVHCSPSRDRICDRASSAADAVKTRRRGAELTSFKGGA
ncbi:MAG: hypothetical protein KYX69_12155 [Sphingomonas sp.]|uniref:hypothetical protein n=1 Tax=Sphingomonas sp. TaxID=28214 RepID=UPI00262F14D2|nr:hypothetical protein [Sphingomonas sp.]MDK2768457.1 hypothetical protein [Sphingomonas sp.]